jgi:hypothetical protein
MPHSQKKGHEKMEKKERHKAVIVPFQGQDSDALFTKYVPNVHHADTCSEIKLKPQCRSTHQSKQVKQALARGALTLLTTRPPP